MSDLNRLVFHAGQVRNALLPQEAVVVIPDPNAVVNVIPNVELLAHAQVEQDRPRKSRVELTIQQKLNICAAIEAMKPEATVAAEFRITPLSICERLSPSCKRLHSTRSDRC